MKNVNRWLRFEFQSSHVIENCNKCRHTNQVESTTFSTLPINHVAQIGFRCPSGFGPPWNRLTLGVLDNPQKNIINKCKQWTVACSFSGFVGTYLLNSLINISSFYRYRSFLNIKLVVPIGKCQRAKYECLFVRTDTDWFSIELYNLK